MDARRLFQIKSNTLEPQPGDLLLSEPTMNDLHFGRSVVLLIDHNAVDGSFGIIMNKPLRTRVNEVTEVFEGFDAPLYLGGPVAENQLFFMHTLGDLIPEASKIIEGLYWGGDAEVLNTLIATGIANTGNTRFFLGYSGWESGQLTSELVRNSWAVSHTDASTIFNTPSNQLWKVMVNQMGKEYALWSRFPRNPEEN